MRNPGWLYSRGIASVMLLAALFLFAANLASAKTGEVESILRGAYGESLAGEAQGIVGSLDLQDDEVIHFRETVDIFRENGFSARSCLDYVNLAYGLNKVWGFMHAH